MTSPSGLPRRKCGKVPRRSFIFDPNTLSLQHAVEVQLKIGSNPKAVYADLNTAPGGLQER